MKRYVSVFLVALLILSYMLIGSPEIYAAQKTEKTRAIAIVFDNSGSMYENGKKEWCRATYAVEVFASMLNPGDILQLYPMGPIEIGGKEYTMENPYTTTDVSKASMIRDLYCEETAWTDIETIDAAAEGLKKQQADEKYLVILTDGDTFFLNGSSLGTKTKGELDKRIQALAGNDMTVMYLGIGAQACMPDTRESQCFFKRKASNSADTLSALTEMCNQIFGRDTLPKNHISGRSIDFDISMSKLIVFVQGEDITGLKVTNSSGAAVGTLASSQQTKYSTKGAGNYKDQFGIDTSLQGMIVTYTDCAAGNYNISFGGQETSIEVYYEPNADLDFVFTDAAGNTVDPNALYEGDYKVSFGMKDAKTGKLIESDLLGSPKYQGSYFINGQEQKIDQEGFSGSIDIPLAMDDTFKATLTVTYLSGYTITKDSSDFGWPESGIKVLPKPAGDLRLEISGGESQYSLQNLKEGEPFIAKVYYQDQLLTGKELEKVELRWQPETSNAEITKDFAEDHWELHLEYKDPEAPQDTVCGTCTVEIYAHYAAQGSSEAQAKCPLTYNIKDDFSPLRMDMVVPESYLVIGEMDQSQPIVVHLTFNRQKLTPEEFEKVQLQVDCGGIKHTVTPNPQDSSYTIQLASTEAIVEGDYPINVTATYTDNIGREVKASDDTEVTLSNIPLWVRWAIGLLLLLILLLIIWAIMHIKVMPGSAHFSKKECKVLVDGEDVTKFCSFNGSASDITVKYGGNKFGLAFPGKAGKESYLCKKQTKRYAEVANPATVKRIGNANIESATIGSVRYVLNDKNVMERKPASKSPLNIKHGMPVIYSGTFLSAGVKKSFNVNAKFNFKKK